MFLHCCHTISIKDEVQNFYHNLGLHCHCSEETLVKVWNQVQCMSFENTEVFNKSLVVQYILITGL